MGRLLDEDDVINTLWDLRRSLQMMDNTQRADLILQGVYLSAKKIEQLPSAQPERLTDDDFETIRIHLNAYKEKLCNLHRWEEAEEYQRIINRFMSFASAQPEIVRCKDCKHRPIEKDGEIMPPKEDDWKCPCLCDDYFYSWRPKDNFFCASGERQEE